MSPTYKHDPVGHGSYRQGLPIFDRCASELQPAVGHGAASIQREQHRLTGIVVRPQPARDASRERQPAGLAEARKLSHARGRVTRHRCFCLCVCLN